MEITAPDVNYKKIMRYKQQAENTTSGNGFDLLDVSPIEGVCYSSNENARTNLKRQERKRALGYTITTVPSVRGTDRLHQQPWGVHVMQLTNHRAPRATHARNKSGAAR